MYREHEVAVVVPAYNEQGFVTSVVEAIPAYVDRVYAVDDASTDGTWNELLAVVDGHAPWDDPLPPSLDVRIAATRHDSHVVALRHARNQGAGGAVKTGYLAALVEGVDLVATIDGDGQMDPGLLDQFLAPLVNGSADYTKGSRFERPADLEGMPAFRQFGNTLLTHLARVVTGFGDLSDPVNGYTAITRQALQTIDVPTLYEGYGYGIDVLGRLHRNDCCVVDVPNPARYADETSSIQYHTYVPRVARLLALTAFRGPHRTHSLLGAGVLGALAIFRFGPTVARIASRTGRTEQAPGSRSSQESRRKNGGDSV